MKNIAPSGQRGESAKEADLMAKLARGDVSALGTLYDTHAEMVRRFAMRATGELSVAEDVTHDTFVALIDSAKRYDDQYPVRSFIIGIAGKHVLRRRRRLAVAARVFGDMRKWMRRAEERTPEAEADTHQSLERYKRALERLSPAKRVAVLMADAEGLSGAEIAAALDIPIGTVWTRLHHARSELRHAMKEGTR